LTTIKQRLLANENADKQLAKDRIKTKRLKKRKLMRDDEGEYSGEEGYGQEAPIAVLATPSERSEDDDDDDD